MRTRKKPLKNSVKLKRLKRYDKIISHSISFNNRNRLYSRRSPSILKSLYSKPYSTLSNQAPDGKLKPLLKFPSQPKKLSCKEKLKRNDDIRRKNFFASKNRGGSSRPEHKKNHKRTC